LTLDDQKRLIVLSPFAAERPDPGNYRVTDGLRVLLCHIKKTVRESFSAEYLVVYVHGFNNTISVQQQYRPRNQFDVTLTLGIRRVHVQRQTGIEFQCARVAPARVEQEGQVMPGRTETHAATVL